METETQNQPRMIHPRLLGLIVVAIAVLAGWVTFDYSYCGALRCDYSSKPQATQMLSIQPMQLPIPNQSEQNQEIVPAATSNQPPTHLAIGDTVITVEYATTTAEEELGLSNRPSLAPLAGMWFVVNPPAPQGMWMPDMNFALDMVWFDQNMRVIYIAQDVTPQSYPKVFAPSQPASYVLEVNDGFVAAHGVAVGQTVSFSQ